MRRWAFGVSVAVACALIASAGMVSQIGSPQAKPFAGAILAVVTPITLGFLIGFLFGFDPESGENTLLARCMKIILSLLAGATLASLGDARILAEKCLPGAAEELCLSSTVLLLVFPTFFVPSFIAGYLWQGRRLVDLTELLALLGKAIRPESVACLVLRRSTVGQDHALDRHKEGRSELLGRFPDEVSPLIPAMSLYKDGDYEGALRRLASAKLSAAEENQASLITGASLMRLKRWEQSLKAFSAITDVAEFSPGIYILLARCYLGIGDLQRAQEYCSRYLVEHPGDREAVLLQRDIRKGYAWQEGA